jgi:hypothetical protein
LTYICRDWTVSSLDSISMDLRFKPVSPNRVPAWKFSWLFSRNNTWTVPQKRGYWRNFVKQENQAFFSWWLGTKY